MQQDTRRAAGSHGRTRGALVAAEVALALVLLVSSGLLLRSLQRLFAVPSGIDSTQLLTMQIQIVGHRYDDNPAASQLIDRMLQEVRQVPGVRAAAVSSQLPLSSDDDEYGAQFEATPTEPAATYNAFRYSVSPAYLETMRIPLRRGRTIDPNDVPGRPLVAVISEALARARFRNADPLGQQLSMGGTGPYTIVGVVGDVKQVSLGLSDAEAVYVPFAQWSADRTMSLVVRAPGHVAALAPAIRNAVWSVDKDQPVVRVATMEDLVARSAAERRFALIVFEAFALAALVLAAAGIYGLLAGSVAERTREMGVRSALGASRNAIVGLVLRQGLRLTTVGMAVGLAGAYAASRAIAAMLFGISRADPLTYLGVVLLLVAVSLAACVVPAFRAARVEPATALKAE
jgi:putative ABC transport system permease protein